MSLRDRILQASDAEIVPIEIPEWGCTVHVRTMQASTRDRFEAGMQDDPFKDLRARLAVATLCDESGELLFAEADVPALAKKNAKALDRILEVGSRLNKLTRDDVAELKNA